MGNVAKAYAAAPGDLPGAGGRVGLVYGLPLRAVLQSASLAGARVLAGAAGLDRVVSRVNVMEVPDILPWVKPDELLLTTGYPLRESAHELPELVTALHERGLAALAVKLGRYLQDLPAAMLERADELGLPIVRLPDDIAFDDVLNPVLTDVLNRQAAMLASSEAVHRALVQIVLAGGGLDEVCSELSRLLDAVVFVTSPDGRILAQAGAPEAIEAATSAPCFDASGRFRTEFERRGISTHEGLDGSHALVPVVAGSLDHGRLVAVAERMLDASDIHALEGASTVAALAITKSLAVRAVEEKYRGDFLRDVLAGRAGSPGDVVAHAAGLGWDLDRPVAVLVAELDPVVGSPLSRSVDGLALRPVRERFTTAWQSVLAARDPFAAVAGFSKEVVAVIGAPPGRDLERAVRELTAAVSGDGGGGRRSFSTGVSRVVSAPGTDRGALPGAYEQARTAVRVGRHLHGAGALAHFDGLGVLRLLSLIPDGHEIDAFVAETLGRLADLEDAEATDLRRTLRVLLDHNLNVAEAARMLHFHYNTLRYRIGKLEGMLGPFTTDPGLRLDLMLALQVIGLREDARRS
ncbi:MAG TPA: PucR family transcriptional regulator ligand-binding domain-containing protein [Actinomycetes bacterium]|nr:PucR family transcriptional regulator ligand-binding domain-containing protein [Actinomycetes bacterium]